MAYPAISGVEDPRFLGAALIRGDQIIRAPMSVHHQFSNVFNVLDYGDRPDGIASNQAAIDEALDLAKAAKGTVYLPGVFTANGLGYRGSISATDHKGLRIKGDGYQSSVLTHFNTALNTIEILGTASGDSAGIIIEGLHVNGTSGAKGIYIHNVIGYELIANRVFGPTVISGSQGGPHIDNWLYGAPALTMGVDDINITGTGPTTFIGGQMTNFASGATEPALKIIGNVMNCNFHTVQFSATLTNNTVTINGLTGQTTAYGCVNFYDCHTESVYNAANNGADFVIGNTSVFGHVGFRGGNYFGHGNGTLIRQDCIRVHTARSVVVDGVMFTNLGSGGGGYSRAAIRLETGFPFTGQQYAFRSLIVLNSIPTYSDANGVLTVYTGNDFDIG